MRLAMARQPEASHADAGPQHHSMAHCHQKSRCCYSFVGPTITVGIGAYR